MIVFDTESDGFVEQATRMWIATTICSKTEEMNIFIDHNCLTPKIMDWVESEYGIIPEPDYEFCPFLQNQKAICAHNIFKHDLPLLKKLYNFTYEGKIRDTLTMSTLYDPDRRVKGFQGGHSIAAWGHKFGIPKPEHEDWSQFSIDMIVRNVEDTKIGLEVYRHLMKMFKQARRKGIDWSESFLLEHDIADIIAECEQTGVVFDVEHAEKALEYFDKRMDKTSSWLLKRLPHLPSCPTAKCKPEEYLKKMCMVANNCELSFDEDCIDPEERYYPPITTIWVKSGDYNSNVKKFFGEWLETYDIWGPFTKVQWEPINLTSVNQIKKYLEINDWIPDEFTPTGSPKVTASSLAKFKHPKIGQRLADYLTLAARRRTILNDKDDKKGWLNNIRPDGRIPSLNNPQGTPTGRSRHKLIVNVPSVDADYGSLMRDCFITKSAPTPTWSFERVNRSKSGKPLNTEGNVWQKGEEVGHITIEVKNQYALVGCDASGLEMRMLAHEMGDMELVDIILNDDIHTYIWKVIEDMSSSRGNTKGIEYACVYGSGDRKLGSLVDVNRDMILEKDLERKGWKYQDGIWRKGEQEFETFFDAQSFELGKILRAKLMAGLPALHEAIERNKSHVKKHGYLIGLDGRRLKARSAHSALNLKLQSGGAIVMKKALQLLYRQLTKRELDAKLIIFYHDEFQLEVHPDIRDKVGRLACKAIQKAGEHFNLKCPLDGEYKIGQSWGDAH